MPAPTRAKTPLSHKLGWKSHDLAELRKEHAQKLDRLISKTMDRFEKELDSIPGRYLAIPIGILIDKRLALDTVPSSTVTQNNTVVINGFSRAEAFAFLNGAQAGKGFSTSDPAPGNLHTNLLQEAIPIPDSAQTPKLSTKTR